MEYARFIAWAAETPWALRPYTLAVLRDVLRHRAGGERLSREDIAARVAARHLALSRDAQRYYDPEVDEFYSSRWNETAGAFEYRADSGKQMPRGKQVVAVLGVYGIISQRANLIDDISGPGGSSIEQLTARFRSCVADPAVKAIVFDHDSPGGSVYGVQELADEIQAARGTKPLFSVANSLAASADYWLFVAVDPGNAAVTPSGEVGSIGVYSAHEDISAALEAEGIKVTLVSAGKYKTEGNPFEPLDDDAKGYMQTRVSDYYNAFVKSVARARGVAPDDVRKGFGQGRVVGASDAVKLGMADRVATLDETVKRAGGRSGAPAQSVALAMTPGEYAEHEAAAARRRLL